MVPVGLTRTVVTHTTTFLSNLHFALPTYLTFASLLLNPLATQLGEDSVLASTRERIVAVVTVRPIK